jgi:hypothetical protein
MSLIEQICSNPATFRWVALCGWLLYVSSEAIGASSLRNNTTLGFVLRVLQQAFPVEIEVKPKRRRSSNSSTRARSTRQRSRRSVSGQPGSGKRDAGSV